MKLPATLSILTLTTLTQSTPIQNDKAYDIPYGAFPPLPQPTTTTPATPKPTLTSTPRLGRAVITNHCKTPIYIWSVGSTVRPEVTVLPDEGYAETFRKDTATGGIAIKISTERDGLYTSAPQTIFAYNLSGRSVWYDLSDVFGDPFKGEPVVLAPAEPRIVWNDGVPPAGSQVRVHDASSDLVLTVC